MKKLRILSITLLAGILSCNAQKTQDRTVPLFTKIKISGGANIYYTTSDSASVKVNASDKEIANVTTMVENETLIINTKGVFEYPINVYIKNKQLTSIEASGASKFTGSNLLKTESLDLSVSGAAQVNLKTETSKLNCLQSGASYVNVGGKSESLNLVLSGASSFKAYSLITTNGVINTSGASSAKVYVTDNAKISASGASSVKVKGDPKELNADATPAASITKIDSPSSSKDRNDGDTTTLTFKTKRVLIFENPDYRPDTVRSTNNNDEFKHWAGFSMGVNGYFNPSGGLNVAKAYKYMDVNYSRSFNFQFNLVERHIKLAKHYAKLVTGFGFDYHSYSLANKTTLNADSSFTAGKIDSSNTYTYKKNKLRNTYIQVPLLLEFNTSNNPEKTFHIAFGVIGEYLISSRTKQVLELGKNDVKRVRKDSYNMSPFVAKAHVNFGYKGWTFFGEYNLTPLFEKGKGPELYPFTAGLRVIPFT